ncbi:MAG: hypothetical protein IIB38_17600 [Candidatus Hydrogenedentes bacterium]|nr:hypothetical protein [Candidatus Hydrogenedentota bacterium]
MNSRDSFLQNVRRALGREQGQPPTPDDASHIWLSDSQVEDRAKAVRERVETFASRLEYYCTQAPLQWFNFYDFWADTDHERE